MFKSEFSGKQYKKGEKPLRVVTATRTKVYYEKGIAVGRGIETVAELSIGPDEKEVFEASAFGRQSAKQMEATRDKLALLAAPVVVVR